MKNLINTTTGTILAASLLLTMPSLADNEQSLKSREHQSKSEIAITDNSAALASDRKAAHNRQKMSADEITKHSKPKEKKLRDSNRTKLAKSLDFDIASAYVNLLYDQDLDGYYSEFSVNFDADTTYEYADVYAELYLSLNGGPWELYHITDVFEIRGASYYDDYTVTTLLTEGYPPGSYDVLVDLIDYYDGSWVATIGPDESYDLYGLPLEDITYEDSSVYGSSVSFYDAYINLQTDVDNDGFYTTYSLIFDADVDFGTSLVYAEVWMRDGSGNWFLETVTEDYLLDNNSALDTYILEATLQSGYNTGYYDFKIDMYDAYTGEFLTSSDVFDYQLSQVPLEDETLDRVSNSTTTTTITTSTVSVESGGAGTSGLFILILTLGAGLLRRLTV